MLPTAPLPSTRIATEDTLTLQPVRPSTGVLDVLSEFVPGEKVVALIQAQLANGAYRATIAQRDVTLALPFMAKPGDALDLEVVQTDGRVAFAVTRPQAAPAGLESSATTTLSRTGQLIGRLLAGAEPDQAPTVLLNGNRPILGEPAATARDNAAPLQQALARSGLFYESHLAQWASGKTPEAALRTEPQALLGRLLGGPAAGPASPGAQAASQSGPATGSMLPGSGPAEMPAAPAGVRVLAETLPAPRLQAAGQAPAASGESEPANGSGASGTEPLRAAGPRSGLPAELAPLVQQQLSSLASNVYAFQGVLWAGQPFRWEIVDEDAGRARAADEEQRPWKTRLKLLLPFLGDIDATLQVDGDGVSISMTSGRDGTPTTLAAGRDRLRERMELAGLRLLALDIRPAAAPDASGGRDGATE